MKTQRRYYAYKVISIHLQQYFDEYWDHIGPNSVDADNGLPDLITYNPLRRLLGDCLRKELNEDSKIPRD